MTQAIISIICTSLLIGFVVYANRKYSEAVNEKERVEAREKRLRGMYKPPVSYAWVIDEDRHCVIVGGRWWIGNFIMDANFKEFPYDPNDAEDKAFAIREAEELIDKLKEK